MLSFLTILCSSLIIYIVCKTIIYFKQNKLVCDPYGKQNMIRESLFVLCSDEEVVSTDFIQEFPLVFWMKEITQLPVSP